jgi:acyl carrier protein
MDVRDALLDIFGTLEFDPDEIDDNTRVRDDLAIDSTELTEIVIAIEKKLDVVIDDDEFQQLQTFGDVVKYVAAANRAE